MKHFQVWSMCFVLKIQNGHFCFSSSKYFFCFLCFKVNVIGFFFVQIDHQTYVFIMITLALLLFIGIQIPLSDYRLLVPFLLFKGTYFYTVGCLSYSLFPSILFSSFLISFIPSLRKNPIQYFVLCHLKMCKLIQL